MAKYNSYEDARQKPVQGDPAAASSDLQQRQRNLNTWAMVTDVLTVAAVLSGGVALYVTLAPDEADRSNVGLPSGARLETSFEF
jgi:hypothetical protein